LLLTGSDKPLAVIFSLCLGAMVGCDSDDDDSTNNDAGSNSSETSMPADNNEGAVRTDPSGLLDGTWVICFPENIIPSATTDNSISATVIITGDTLSSTSVPHLNQDCSQPVVGFPDVVQSTSLEFPEGTTETSLGTAFWINTTLESFTVNGLPATAEQVAAAESDNGFDTMYDIFIVADDGNLYLGDTLTDGAGDSPETRASELILIPHIRQ